MRIGQEAFYGIWSGRKPRPEPDGAEASFDLEEVGQLLKDAREKRGVTLEEIADALFIRRQVVRAIEAGDWAALPPLVYVKGYVTQYASFLDILDLVQRELSPDGDGPREGAWKP